MLRTYDDIADPEPVADPTQPVVAARRLTATNIQEVRDQVQGQIEAAQLAAERALTFDQRVERVAHQMGALEILTEEEKDQVGRILIAASARASAAASEPEDDGAQNDDEGMDDN